MSELGGSYEGMEQPVQPAKQPDQQTDENPYEPLMSSLQNWDLEPPGKNFVEEVRQSDQEFGEQVEAFSQAAGLFVGGVESALPAGAGQVADLLSKGGEGLGRYLADSAAAPNEDRYLQAECFELERMVEFAGTLPQGGTGDGIQVSPDPSAVEAMAYPTIDPTVPQVEPPNSPGFFSWLRDSVEDTPATPADQVTALYDRVQTLHEQLGHNPGPPAPDFSEYDTAQLREVVRDLKDQVTDLVQDMQTPVSQPSPPEPPVVPSGGGIEVVAGGAGGPLTESESPEFDHPYEGGYLDQTLRKGGSPMNELDGSSDGPDMSGEASNQTQLMDNGEDPYQDDDYPVDERR
jgi:hypothetical protein